MAHLSRPKGKSPKDGNKAWEQNAFSEEEDTMMARELAQSKDTKVLTQLKDITRRCAKDAPVPTERDMEQLEQSLLSCCPRLKLKLHDLKDECRFLREMHDRLLQSGPVPADVPNDLNATITAQQATITDQQTEIEYLKTSIDQDAATVRLVAQEKLTFKKRLDGVCNAWELFSQNLENQQFEVARFAESERAAYSGDRVWHEAAIQVGGDMICNQLLEWRSAWQNLGEALEMSNEDRARESGESAQQIAHLQVAMQESQDIMEKLRADIAGLRMEADLHTCPRQRLPAVIVKTVIGQDEQIKDMTKTTTRLIAICNEAIAKFGDFKTEVFAGKGGHCPRRHAD